MKPIHVVLTGPRAVGKSTIGRGLAQQLEMAFVDLDEAVLDHFGQSSVSEVWQAHGESAWRDMECRVLHDLLETSPKVLALGGGVPTIPAAAEALNRARREGLARIIWLQTDPMKLAARLEASSGDRPSLTGKTPAEEIVQVCEARKSSYEAVSDCSLDVGSMDQAQAIEAVVDLIK